MVEEITQANLILTNSLDKEILAQSKKGSQVIFFAEKGDGVKNKAHYSFRQLDIGGKLGPCFFNELCGHCLV